MTPEELAEIDISDEAIAALCEDLREWATQELEATQAGEGILTRAADTIEALAKENRINAGALDIAKAELDRQLTENLELVADLDAERAKVERLWLAGSALLAHANEVDCGGWSERNEMAKTLTATEPTS